jgi:hypothetical protein
MLLAYTFNNTLGRKGFQGTNALAYFSAASGRKKFYNMVITDALDKYARV